MRKCLFVLTGCVLLSLSVSDVGQSETPTMSPSSRPTASVVQCMISAPGGVLFAGTLGEGVFRSADDAESWEPSSSGLANLNVLSIVTMPSGDVFGGTFGGGVFRSVDGGRNWAAVNNGLPDLEVVALASSVDGVIYAATSAGGVFQSDNRGRSWTYVGLERMFISSIAVTPGGEVVAAVAGEGLYLLSDDGFWTGVYQSHPGKDIWDITVSSSGQLFIASNGGGVLRSDDGGKSWAAINTGLTDLNTGAISVSPSNVLLVGTAKGIFRSVDDGRTWTHLPSSPVEEAIRCLTSGPDGSVFAGTLRGEVLKGVHASMTMR